MTIPSIDSFSNYNKYKSEAGYTKQADMMWYLANQNDCLTALTQALLWQPETAYEVGKVIQSPTMPTGVRARVTQAGTSGQAEPAWTDAGTTVTDGTITYTMESLDYAALIAAATSSLQATMTEAIATAKNAMDFNMLKRNKAYSIGDIAYSSYLPSWARLECVTAGITAGTVPSSLTMVSRAGLLVSDGTVTWIVDDVRDGNRVSDIVLKPTLNDGYIKANGATVKASEYPRLLKFAQDNSLCVSDSEWSENSATKYVYNASADTLKIPNAMGRVLQGEDALATKTAGLPNITGYSALGGYTGKTDKSWGALKKSVLTTNAGFSAYQTNDTDFSTVYFDASMSNAIYGSSDTVQPPACCLIAQIKY